MNTLLLRTGLAAALLFGAAGAWAQQYRSEVRELDAPPPAEQEVDLREQLKSAADPYAKAMILRELAGQAASQKDYKQAAALLEQALKTNGLSGPAAQQVREALSELTLATGNFKTQLPMLEKRAREPGASPEIFIALGSAYLDLKRYPEAITALKKGIAGSANPDPSWKQALLGALLATGREAEALPLLQEQVRAQPQLRENWLRLAAMAVKAGDKERAAATLELAARQGHLKTSEERLQLINLTAQIGAPFEAGSLMQGWMEEGVLAKDAGNYSTLAALWSRARESGLASAALEQAQRLSPSAERLLQLGQLQMNQEDYARAAQSLEKAINSGARSGPAWMTLAMARYQQAEVEAAVDAFRQAAEYPQSRKLAQDWLKYLESGAAREQALMALERRQPREHAAAASLRLGEKLGATPLALEGEVASRGSSTPVAAGSSGDGALTPVGAERGGNADGRIPAWAGGLRTPPASYQPGQRLSDPYPQDQPLFRITAANVAQYAAQLSKGHKALFARYADYVMPVYQTRRSASYPQAIYDATQANLGKAKLLGSDALEGARLGFPFPKPQNGVEVMWNHRTRYRGDTVKATYTQAVVQANGRSDLTKQSFLTYFRYGNVKDPVDIARKNILVYGITSGAKPGGSPEFVALFHETANSLKDPRDVWVLLTRVGKMFRVPPVGYDQPFPGSDGLEFIDMVDMYNGAFDRYVWKLIGKRELYIPYNAYRLSDGRVKYNQLLKGGHPDQGEARYELHRVWVIEASERGGKRHVFGKRTYYVDEDSWNVVLVENEDREGNLWRFQEGHVTPLYDVQAVTTVPSYTYDLKDGRYFANRLFSEDAPFQYNLPMKEADFLPATVRVRYGR